MKQYNEPIQVEVGDDGLPHFFRWRSSRRGSIWWRMGQRRSR
jgi:hypothetical protein